LTAIYQKLVRATVGFRHQPEYPLLVVIQLAAVTVIMFAVCAWINDKWTVLNSAFP